jgi:CRP/FNR family cyclic AMP-dependent transcriptional regulator
MQELAQHWLFAELDTAEKQKLLRLAIHHRVSGGTVLFRRDDPTPGLHLVVDGAIKIYSYTPEGEERIIDLIGLGEFCGEMGVVDAAPSGAWGEAVGSTEFWVIPASTFGAMLAQHPSTCLKVCRVLVSKLRRAAAQLDETIFLSARTRVLRQLVRLVDRHGTPRPDGVQVGLRLTHQEVALMVGTARETVSRVLAELQDRHVVRFEGRQMVVRDLAAMRRMASADGDLPSRQVRNGR